MHKNIIETVQVEWNLPRVLAERFPKGPPPQRHPLARTAENAANAAFACAVCCSLRVSSTFPEGLVFFHRCPLESRLCCAGVRLCFL